MKTNKKILLVEDDSNFGRILKEYLSINNYNVDLASNGIEGYEKFNRSEYDLCILDVMMPYKDGFTLAKEIREKNDQIPIIFLTAFAKIKGWSLGWWSKSAATACEIRLVIRWINSCPPCWTVSGDFVDGINN